MAGRKRRRLSKSRKRIQKKRRSRSRKRQNTEEGAATHKEPTTQLMPLRNFDNTCHTNALLQCLSASNKVSQSITTFKPFASADGEKMMISNLQSIMKFGRGVERNKETLQKAHDNFVNITLPQLLGFPTDQQQDPAEVLEKLLSVLDGLKNRAGHSCRASSLINVTLIGSSVPCEKCDFQLDPDVELGPTVKVLVPKTHNNSSLTLEEILHRRFTRWSGGTHMCMDGEAIGAAGKWML